MRITGMSRVRVEIFLAAAGLGSFLCNGFSQSPSLTQGGASQRSFSQPAHATTNTASMRSSPAFSNAPMTKTPFRQSAALDSCLKHDNVKYTHRTLSANGPLAGSTTARNMFSPAAASLISGSVAGAVGVGVAFPFDTVKTKAQVMGQQATAAAASVEDLNMFQMFYVVWQAEGLAGFFGGVKTMMLGQAFVKAVAFSSNAFALSALKEQFPVLATQYSVLVLVMAACFSGFVSSFIVSPVERIKVMMQAGGTSTYKNELDCARVVVQNEGLFGLLGRGLGPTIAREVPGYGIYFVVYGLLIQSSVAQMMGAVAPLVCGALAGCACWVPVYPVDVVKTLLQNSDGTGDSAGEGFWDVAKTLYENGGVGAFFDGLTPKMLRAAVNHAVTFWIYDLVLRYLTTGPFLK